MPALFGNGRGWIAFAIILLILAQAVMMGLSAFATRQVFNSLHLPGEHDAQWALFTLLGAALAYAILRVSALGLSEKLGQAYAIDFRRNFYMHLSRSPSSSLSERRVGALSIRFVGDLAAMRDWVSLGLTGLASAVIIVPAALLTLWLLQPEYLKAATLPLIALAALALILAPKLKPIHRQLRSERANLAIDMTERAPIANELRLLGRAKADFKLLKRRGENLQTFAVSRIQYLEWLKALPEIATGISAVWVLWLTTQSADISAATAAAALAVLGIMVRPLMELGRVWDIYCSWLIAKEKSENVFSRKRLKRIKSGQKINTDAISYTLDAVKISGLDTINFHAPAGSLVGIRRGDYNEQQLIHVLATLEDPLQGCIKLNDIPLNKIALNSLPKLIHLLSLKKALFVQGSLRRALSFSSSKRPSEKALQAQIEKFGLNQLLLRLGGLGGRVWEGARNLSEEEKFRILLVRAALKPDAILIIEDPGSSVSEAAQAALVELLKSHQASCFLLSNSKKLLEHCDSTIELSSEIHTANDMIAARQG